MQFLGDAGRVQVAQYLQNKTHPSPKTRQTEKNKPERELKPEKCASIKEEVDFSSSLLQATNRGQQIHVMLRHIFMLIAAH